MGVDVSWEGLLPLEVWVGNPTVLQSEALQCPWLAGQLPVHLHGSLVQDLREETGRTGNCGQTGQTVVTWYTDVQLKQTVTVFKVDLPPPCVVAVMVLDC